MQMKFMLKLRIPARFPLAKTTVRMSSQPEGKKKNPKRENGLLGMKSVNLKGKQVSEGIELESFELEREVG